MHQAQGPPCPLVLLLALLPVVVVLVRLALLQPLLLWAPQGVALQLCPAPSRPVWAPGLVGGRGAQEAAACWPRRPALCPYMSDME